MNGNKELQNEIRRLREALQEIHNITGTVCSEYDTCEHLTCAASYNAWALSEKALKKEEENENQ